MKRSVGIAKKLNNKKKKIIIIGSIFFIFVISIITLITTGGLSKLMGNSMFGKEVTVIYDANGGTGNMESHNLKIESGAKIHSNQFTTPNPNVHFIGWEVYNETQGKYLYVFHDYDTKNSVIKYDNDTFYWYKSDYSLSNLDAPFYNGDKKDEFSLKESFIMPDNFDLSSLNFNEGQINNGDVLKLFAIWDGTRTINFDANGGTGEMKPVNTHVYSFQIQPYCFFEKEGYNFEGWSLYYNDIDSWNCHNTERKSFDSSCIMSRINYDLFSYSHIGDKYYYGRDITLVANWKKNDDPLIIKYDANGGINTMGDQNAGLVTIGSGRDLGRGWDSGGGVYKSTKANKNAFAKAGYKFKGWYSYLSNYPSPVGGWYSKCRKNGKIVYSYLCDYEQEKILIPDSGEIDNVPYGNDITLEAQWEPTIYTVKYNANGGTGNISNQDIKYDAVEKLYTNRFTRAGYKFKGWVAQRSDGTRYCYTNSSKRNINWVNADTCAKNGYYHFLDGSSVKNLDENGGVVTMFAQWEANHFTVKFNSNGANGKMADQQMTYGGRNKLNSNTFTKSGYVFNGWVAQRWDGLKYCYTSPSKVAADWVGANTCKNFGYYIFANNIVLTKTVPAGKTVTMFAQWKTNQFTVRFNSNGGSGSMSEQKMTYGVKNTLKSNAYTKSGYVFNGWVAQRWDDLRYCYTSPSKTSAAWLNKNACANNGYYIFANNIKLDTTVPAGRVVTMYAQWKTNQFTVRFNSNGGSGSMSEQKMTYGVKNTLKSNAYKKNGYIFTGWIAQRWDDLRYCYTSPSQTSAAWLNKNICANNGYYIFANNIKLDTTVPAGRVVTMYAQWKSDQYTIRYYAGGGTGEMSDQKTSYNTTIKLNPNRFTRSGYEFIGWNIQRGDEWYCYTSPSRTQTAWSKTNVCENNGYYLYHDKQSVSKMTSPGKVVRAVAQWRSTHYTIRYYPSGGSGTMKDQKVDYSSAASLSKNNFTRKNYKFIGWHAHRVNENTWKCYTSPSKTKTAWLPKNTCENNGYYLVPDKYNILYFAPKNTVVNMYAQWKKK